MTDLVKSVRRARWRDSYKLVFGLVMLFGCALGAYNLEGHVNPPPKLTSGYHGYSGGTTQFRDLEVRDGGKLSFYPDASRSCGGNCGGYFTSGNTSIGDASSDVVTIGDASSDTVTINGFLVNCTVIDSKTLKCKN